jgi:hypothetical protein
VGTTREQRLADAVADATAAGLRKRVAAAERRAARNDPRIEDVPEEEAQTAHIGHEWLGPGEEESESVHDETIDNILEQLADLAASGASASIDAFSFSHAEENLPTSIRDALTGPEAHLWRPAIEEEFASIKDMGVYELVPRTDVPAGRRVMTGKAVFKRKTDGDGNVVRYKVRWVAKGFLQVPGVDFDKTTSPTARIETLRVLYHLAAVNGWDMEQIDVKTAFLYGILEEECYMEQPRGFEVPSKEGWVWRLRKGLYGTKQGGRAWNKELNRRMISWGFTRVPVEHCLYYRKTGDAVIMAAVHVDDFICASNSRPEIERLKEQMKSAWKITTSGEPSFAVGVRVRRDLNAKTIFLDQAAYLDRVIHQFHQKDANSSPTPLEPNLRLSKKQSPSSPEDQAATREVPYRALVGSLMYLAVWMRPDIMQAVRHLSQFLANPGQAHWQSAIRVLRYCKGTRDFGLLLGGTAPLQLRGWVDSDWANCPDTRRSVTAYGFSLGSGLVSWSSRKQQSVTTSSTEAEYVAACAGAKEAVWLRHYSRALGFLRQQLRSPATIKVPSSWSRTPPSTTARSTFPSSITTLGSASRPAKSLTIIFPPRRTLSTCSPSPCLAPSSNTSGLLWASDATLDRTGLRSRRRSGARARLLGEEECWDAPMRRAGGCGGGGAQPRPR